MARLNRKDRTKMAKDNYHKFKAEAFDNMKKGNKPPISESQKRAGSGKGDLPRPMDLKKYQKNYDSIRWRSKQDKVA